MTLTPQIATLPTAPNAPGLLLLPWMLDAAPRVLESLLRASVRLAWSSGGVADPGTVTVTGGSVRVQNCLAVSSDLLPLLIGDETISVAGLADGVVTVCVSPAPVTEEQTWKQRTAQLTAQVPVSWGRLLIVPGVPSDAGAVAAGAVALFSGTVVAGALTDPVDVYVSPTPRVIPVQALAAFGPANLVPLSDAYAPASGVPGVLPWQSGFGYNPYGIYRDFTPQSDVYLAGLSLANQQSGNGQSWPAVVWDAVAQTRVALGSAGVVNGGAVQSDFPEPVQLLAGRTYRIGFNGSTTLTLTMNDISVVYPGFTAGNCFDNYDNRFVAPGSAMPNSSGHNKFTPILLISAGFRAAGVSGRLGRATLPRSPTVLALTDGEAYILATPGTAPELRTREGGTEYKVALVPV